MPIYDHENDEVYFSEDEESDEEFNQEVTSYIDHCCEEGIEPSVDGFREWSEIRLTESGENRVEELIEQCWKQ